MSPQDLFEAYRCRPTPEGLRSLLEAYQDIVYNLTYQVLRHNQDAEDASQQVFIRMLDALPRLNDAQHLKRWVYQASFHAALDLKRSKMRRKKYEQRAPTHLDAPPPQAVPDEPMEVLHDHLSRLDDRSRTLLVDHYYCKQSLADLASRMGCSTVAVWKKLEKARASLRESVKLAGFPAAAAVMDSALEAMVAVQAPQGLLSPAVLAKIASIPAGSPGAVLAWGGAALKMKTAVLVAGFALVAGAAGYGVLRRREAPPVPERTVRRSGSGRGAETEGRAGSGTRGIPASDRPAAGPGKAGQRSRVRQSLDRFDAALKTQDVARMKAALASILEDLARVPVPEGRNAAAVYRKAFEKFSWSEADWVRWEALTSQDPLLPQDRAALKELLEKNRDALSLLHEASRLPDCDFGLDYSRGASMEMPHIPNMIVAAKLLMTESMVAEAGALPEVAKASGRLAEAVADEPVLLSQLVRGLCQQMAAEARERALESSTEEPALRDLLGSLAPERVREGVERSILFEFYSAARALLEGEPVQIQARQVKLRGPEDPLAQADLALLAKTSLEFSDLLGRPYYEVKDRGNELMKSTLDNLPWYADLTRTMMPAFGRTCERIAEVEASLGASAVAAALRIYKVQKGDYPTTLAELGSVVNDVPLDPFTGRPYVYRKEGSGFVVYSVGKDGRDAGGARNVGEPGMVVRVGR